MTTQKRTKSVSTLAAVMTAALALTAASVNAATIAATNFDGRTLTMVNVANDTATGLNWTTGGVDDPGDMTALKADMTGQALFNGAGKITQNMFAPGINVGNGNTFWTTTVDLAVSAGSAVTLTDVTFDYWAINSGQNHNVDRESDFTVTLLNPSAVAVDSVSIIDVDGGTTVGVPTVTATFAAPIALTDPGTYTLEIKAGDFLGSDETGNHTAIDNLSINGNVAAAVIPEPSTLVLATAGLLGLMSCRRRNR